jgi:DNA-binding beta-propeller fold protein YncE
MGSAPTAAPSANACPCVSTVAGSGDMGNVDGMAMAAQFTFPHAVAMDGDAQLHVADYGNDSQTRLIAGGLVFTLAEDATDFPQPQDVAVDADGNQYVADSYGNRILKVSPSGETTVLAGTGESGDADGSAATATFSMPTGLALGADGALYVADMGNRKIRKITLA